MKSFVEFCRLRNADFSDVLCGIGKKMMPTLKIDLFCLRMNKLMDCVTLFKCVIAVQFSFSRLKYFVSLFMFYSIGSVVE